MNSIKIIITFLILKSTIGFGQNITQDSLFNNFKRNVEIEQKQYNDKVRMNYETKEAYYLLLINTSIADLVKYTNDSNAFVRCQIFGGLVNLKAKKEILLKIIANHKNDTAIYINKNSDFVMECSVIDFMKIGLIPRRENKYPKVNYKRMLEKLRNDEKNEPRIAGVQHGKIEKSDFLKLNALDFRNKEFSVASFTFYANGKVIKSLSNEITKEMKALVENMNSGDAIIFEDIKVMARDNSIRSIDYYAVIIK